MDTAVSATIGTLSLLVLWQFYLVYLWFVYIYTVKVSLFWNAVYTLKVFVDPKLWNNLKQIHGDLPEFNKHKQKNLIWTRARGHQIQSKETLGQLDPVWNAVNWPY